MSTAYLWMQHDLRTDKVSYWFSAGAHPNFRIRTTVLALVGEGKGSTFDEACKDAVWMAGLPTQVVTELAATGWSEVFDNDFLQRYIAYHERGELSLQ